jgi:hypothetical protein
MATTARLTSTVDPLITELKMKSFFALIIGMSVVQAEDAPTFTPKFIVPGKFEYLPRMVIDEIAEPKLLRESAERIEGGQTADVTMIVVTDRPFSLDEEASEVISGLFTANEEPAREALRSMPLVGPQRVFALMNADGKFEAIILDYRVAVVITKVRWIGDSYIQPNGAWSRCVKSHELNQILDLASKRPPHETPFETWMQRDRHHMKADRLTPDGNKEGQPDQ